MKTSFNQNLNDLLKIISDNNKLRFIQEHETQFCNIYDDTTYHEFMNSELSKLILNYSEDLKKNKNIDENSVDFFGNLGKFYQLLYKKALTNQSTKKQKINYSTENYIRIYDNEKKIMIPEENWSDVYCYLTSANIPLVKNSKKGLYNFSLETKETFKKILLNAVEILLKDRKNLREIFCKNPNVSEEIHQKKLIDLLYEKLWEYNYTHDKQRLKSLATLSKNEKSAKESQEEHNIKENKHKFQKKNKINLQDYILDPFSFDLVVEIIQKFQETSFTDFKEYNLNYILDKLNTSFIISLQKQKDNQQTNTRSIPLTSLQIKLGSVLVNLISFFINGQPEINFSWHDSDFIKFIYEIKNELNKLPKNKKPTITTNLLLQSYLKNTKNINSLSPDFCKLILQYIFIKAYENLEILCIPLRRDKNIMELTSKQKKLLEIQQQLFCETCNIEQIYQSLTQKYIKLGNFLINFFRIYAPTYIGKNSTKMNSELYPNKIDGKNFKSNILELHNCIEIEADFNLLNRPLLTKKSLMNNTYLKNIQAYLQRIINNIHNNENSYLSCNNKHIISNVRENYVYTKNLNFFLRTLQDELIVSKKINEVVTDDILLTNLKEIPLILSLYYISFEKIMTLYDTTNIFGKKIIIKLINLSKVFSCQTDEEKDIENLLKNSTEFIKNIEGIKDLFNRIISMKYSFLVCIQEMILYSGFEFYSIPYFFDSRGRYYFNNKGLNIQTHYLIRGIIRPYDRFSKIPSNDSIKKINNIITKTADEFFDDRCKKKICIDRICLNKLLTNWQKKYFSNTEEIVLSSVETQENDVLFDQFLNGFTNKFEIDNLFENAKSFKEVIQTISLNLKSCKKLSLKICEFYQLSLAHYLQKIGEHLIIKPLLEYDAVSSGLQMQSILIKSKKLAKTSKLIEGETQDIYTKGQEEYNENINSIKKFITENVSENLDLTFDYKELLEIYDQNSKKILEQLKIFVKLQKKNIFKEKISDINKKKIVFIKNILRMLYEQSTEKQKNKLYKTITIFLEGCHQILDENDELLLLVQNCLKTLDKINTELNTKHDIENDYIYIIAEMIQKNIEYLSEYFTIKEYNSILNIKNSRINILIFYKQLKPKLEQIFFMKNKLQKLEADNKFNWFIEGFLKKSENIYEKILYKKEKLTRTQIFYTRILLLDLLNNEILKKTNIRDIWKQLVMTYSYGSTPYGRLERIATLIKETGYYPNIFVNFMASVYEDFFIKEFQPNNLEDAKTFKEIASIVSKHVKQTNDPFIIKTTFASTVLRPLDKKAFRAPVNAYKGRLRGPVMQGQLVNIDPKTNKAILKYKEILKMFGPNICHVADATIVTFLLQFTKSINYKFYKNEINYRIAIEPNHDSFRSPNSFYLKSLLELAYIFLITENLLIENLSVIKDEKLRKNLEETLKKIENSEHFLKDLLTLGPNFVKF